MKVSSKLSALCLGAAALFTATFAQAETIYLTADAMVDVETGELVELPVIKIEDGVIVSVDVGVPPPLADAQFISLRGKTILPGMIDMHVHLTSDSDVHGYRRLAISDERATITGVVNAKTTLMADSPPFVTSARAALAMSPCAMRLPRVTFRGRACLSPAHRSGSRADIARTTICSRQNTKPRVRMSRTAPGLRAQRSRKNRKYGVDMIKTCSTGGVLSKGTKVGAPQYTVEELTALVEEAHSHGMKVASHAHGSEGIVNALKAGVDTIEHASFIDDEGIRLARENGAYLSMDIYVTEFILGEGEAAGILPESLEKERQVGQTQRDNFRKAHEAGVKMVFGTDAGVYPHGDNARQLSRMVRFGMSSAEALQAATVNAAAALGQEGNVGIIAPGAAADIIAVSGNPLEDISVLENVEFVMKSGEVYKGE